MITKRIENISSDDYPWILGNLAKDFTIESQTTDSITATGSEEMWNLTDFPGTVNFVTV